MWVVVTEAEQKMVEDVHHVGLKQPTQHLAQHLKCKQHSTCNSQYSQDLNN